MRGRCTDRLSSHGRRGSLLAVAVATVALVGVLSGSAAAQTCGTGTDNYVSSGGNWNVAGNWSLGAVPSGSQVACWPLGTTVTVTDTETVDSIQADGDLSIGGGAVLTLASATDQSSVADLFLEGGELDGQSGQTLTITGNFDWGGTATGTAAFNAASGSGLAINQTGSGTFTIDGIAPSAPSFDGGSITTDDPVSITNSFQTSNGPTLTTTSTLTLASATVVTGTGATFVAAALGTGPLSTTYDFGSDGLTLTGAPTVVSSTGVIDSGPLSITGTLQVDGTGAVDPSTATIGTGGILDGTGTVGGTSVTNNAGTVSPGDPSGGTGVLTISGAYTQAGGGTLAIEINGTTAGTGFSQLSVGTTATLAGTLSLTDGSSFTPEYLETFAVLTSATSGSTGNFPTVTGTSGSAYVPTYSTAGVTLTVPAPSSCPASGFDAYVATAGTWSTGANWSTGAPPSPSEVACWGAGTTVTASGTESVSSIEAVGELDVTGGALTLGSSSSVANLSLTGGELDGPSGQTLTVTGNFDWGGNGTGTAALNAATPGSGMAINQTGGGSFTIDGSNATPATPSFDGGSLTTSSPVSITNSNFTATAGATLTTTQAVTFGTSTAGVDLTTGAGTIVAAAIDTLDGGGTNSVENFALHLTAGAASSLATGSILNVSNLTTDALTTLTVPSSSALNVSTGTIFGTINGAGSFATGIGGTGATTTIATVGTLSVDTVALGGGSLTVAAGATYDAAGATTVDGSGTLQLDADGTTGNLSLTGGDLNGGGATLTVTGAVSWTAGAINVPSGTLAIAQTGTGFSTTGSISLGGGSISTGSPVNIASTDFSTSSTPTFTTSSTITLSPSAVISGSGAPFTAAGLGNGSITSTYDFGGDGLTLTGGVTAIQSSGTLTSGPLNLAGSTLQDDGTVTAPAVVLNLGTLDGTGTVRGSVSNPSGTVSPGDPPAPGVLTVTGGYAQGGGGTLSIELGGTTAGSGFSQLQVGGGATSLGGDLSLTDGNGFVPALGNTFKIIGSAATPTGAFTLTGPSAGPYFALYDANDVTLGVRPVPANIVAPTLSGTPAVGQTLSCSSGSWSANPTTFSYQWNRDGSPISGATSSTYVVSAPDQGHSLACSVTASNSLAPSQPATSSSVSVPAAPPAPRAPLNSGAPLISGTATPGKVLKCSNGTWSGGPTGFAYQWGRNGSSIAGATKPTYTVQIADEGSLLTCTVTASNAVGPGTPETGGPVAVAEPGTLSCVKPSGRLSGSSLGPLALGLTRASARRKLTRYTAVGKSVDNFCLYGGWGIRVGYASTKLLRTVSARERARLGGRVVLALTVNPYYALAGARPGTALTAVAKRLRVGSALHIGLNYWYIVPGAARHGVLRVRGGIIQEIGIAGKALTQGRSAQKRFFTAFNGA